MKLNLIIEIDYSGSLESLTEILEDLLADQKLTTSVLEIIDLDDE
ncbi:unnamed protein product [marine sediment metagenome]|uniref:Uncharacterized protein n=1 Tax=marine sediment metagenome TaxID=412755 RepID=X1F1X3_9ZZZZ